MSTDVEMLSAHINNTIKLTDPYDHPRIKASKRVYHTGEPILLFDEPALVTRALETEESWITKLNPKLKVKSKLYTFMVHGMPSPFNLTDPRKIQSFQLENGTIFEFLDSIC